MKKLLSYFMVIGFVLTCAIVPTHATEMNPEQVTEKSFNLSETEIYIGSHDSVKLEIIDPVGVNLKTTNWKTENTAIATVNSDGIVRAVSVGDVKIIANVDGIERECLIHVSKIVHLSLVGVVDGVIIEETRYTSPALLAGQAGFTDEFINSHKQQIDEITKNESGDTYEYVGVYLDAEGTKPINSSIRFNEDATVYMVWKEKVAAKPVEPEKQKPVETNKTESITKSNTEKKKKPVQTSDNQSIMVYTLLTTITGVVFVAMKMRKVLGE